MCGEVIGVYEPVIVFDDDLPRTTSVAREPELGRVQGLIVHAHCGSSARSALDEDR